MTSSALKIALAGTVAALLALASHAIAGDGQHGDHMAKVMEHRAGDLVLTAPFTRATLPNQPVAGGFLKIANTGAEDDVLVAVSSPISGRGEIHEMAMDGDTMKMRELADGLVIPAGDSVELKPGGYHLMFMELDGPLAEGEMLDVTLEFRDAGKVTIPFQVLAKGARSAEHSGHGS